VSQGRLEAIWLKRARRGIMDARPQAELVAGRGLVGNANQGGRRQVTLIEREAWDACMSALDASLPPETRRANLMVSGVRLRKTRGYTLEVGDCLLEVMGETKPCERMEEALNGLKGVMYEEWRGGVFATVVRGGTIRVGDAVTLHEPNLSLALT
jgi:MOSC domain-containing protein YiiM